MYSLVIPVYKNETYIPEVFEVLTRLNRDLGNDLEAVFIVDGSPDRSFELLRNGLVAQSYSSKLVLLSRNFGSFAAIRAGLVEATGPYFAVMAADLQEPPELIKNMFYALAHEEVDVTIGVREHRQDPVIQRLTSSLYWFLYRKLIQREVPPGGVDIFGCNLMFRDCLVAMRESNSSIVGMLFWLGFRRKMILYERRARRYGKSAWTLRRKIRYLQDSIFGFTDLPINMLLGLGLTSLSFFALFSVIVIIAKMIGLITVPGYTATILVVSFFAGLNSIGLGLIGSYVWRTFENTKNRPDSIVMARFGYKEATTSEFIYTPKSNL